MSISIPIVNYAGWARINHGSLYTWTADRGAAGLASTRASDATYISQAGIVTPAGVAVARADDYSTKRRGMLVESERINLVADSEDFAVWGVSGSPNRTAGQSDPMGGFAAYLLDDPADGSAALLRRGVAFTGDGTKSIAIYLKAGTAAQTTVAIWDVTVGYRLKLVITWNNGTPYPGIGGGNGQILAVRELDGDWHRIEASVTGIVAANGHEFRIYPAGGSSAVSGTVYAFGAQAEDAPYPSSYIPTAGATADRAADAIVASSVVPAGIQATRYERYFDRSTRQVVEQVVDVESTTGDVVFASDGVTDRAWYALIVAEGEKTLDEMLIRAGSPVQIVCDGDSLTAGSGAMPGHEYPTLLGAASGLEDAKIVNVGVAGQRISQMIADAGSQIDVLFSSARAKNVVVCWAGTNDIAADNTAPATIASNIQSYCAGRRAAGFKVVVVTTLPRSNSGLGSWFETDRQTLNTLIRNNWQTYADALVDVASDTRIGDSGDSNDSTYYASDHIHLNNAGYEIVAGFVATAVAAL